MEQEKIDRINELARKARSCGLDSYELSEQKQLREEYAASIRESLRTHLDNTYILEPDGTKRKLKPKD